MDSLIITPKTKEDADLLKKMAKRMGLSIKKVKAPGKLKSKEEALKEIRKALTEGFKEIELIRSGKLKAKSFDEFLDEL